MEIPEGVFQIRASSYAKDLNLKVCGESAKLWNQVQRERQNQKKIAIEIEALRSADDALAKESMTSLDLPFLYDGVSNVWEGSSPVLQTYYVPLTVLQSSFVQEIQFTLRTIGNINKQEYLDKSTSEGICTGLICELLRQKIYEVAFGVVSSNFSNIVATEQLLDIHYIFQNGLGEKSYGFRLVFQENEDFLKNSHNFRNGRRLLGFKQKGIRISITNADG